MYYTATLYDPVVGMNQILAAVKKFNPDRFLYALEYKNWDEMYIEKMAMEVADYRGRLESEYKRLQAYAEVFNKEFATMNNKCYSSALTMLYRLRSGISEAKRLVKKHCPRARKESIFHAIGNKPVSAFEYSRISASSYQLELFRFEGYPECVSLLYQEMEEFFLLMVRCMQLCKQVLADEKRIKFDNKYCKYLYEQFKEKVMMEIFDIVMMIPLESEELSERSNPAIASRSKYADDEAWAPIGFHSFTKTEVKQLVIKQVLEEQSANDLTTPEKCIFGHDKEKVCKYRQIIEHFDDLLPEGYSRKNLPAKYIQMFFRYVGVPAGREKEAVVYFARLYGSSPYAKHTMVTHQAVNNCKKDVLIDKDGAYVEFVKRLQSRFFATLPLQMVAS